MSRILLLVLFVVWMAWTPGQSPAADAPKLAVFLGFYAMLVVILGMWSRMLARSVARHNFHRSLRRFNQMMFAARLMVPLWFTVGVWMLGWGTAVADGLGMTLARTLPGVLLGTLPAFAAWIGLWWSQYPADRALREQNILADWENDLPIHQAPPFRSYFSTNLRLQVLFTVVPVLMIVTLRDLFVLIATRITGTPLVAPSQAVDFFASIGAAVLVFLFVPAVLRRVLNTVPLPDSALRHRLEELCRRSGVRYREILLWRTNNNVGNAAVMGMLPWLRYVLLSDVLIERMSDEQIEAVFAHELGHIVHRHMAWYAIFFTILLLMVMPVSALLNMLPMLSDTSRVGLLASLFLGTGGFLLLFGALSRRCERQADVYAARTMEFERGLTSAEAAQILITPRQLAMVGGSTIEASFIEPRVQTFVGPYGARVFVSALRRVAAINNIPISPRGPQSPGMKGKLVHWMDSTMDLANNWFHGSISGRMDYLQNLSADPRLTRRFDQAMLWLYGSLLFALCASAILAVATFKP